MVGFLYQQKGKNKKLTIWSCASYEPALSNLWPDKSQIHTSKDPEPLPTAKSNWPGDCAGTMSESTEIGTEPTLITYVDRKRKEKVYKIPLHRVCLVKFTKLLKIIVSL